MNEMIDGCGASRKKLLCSEIITELSRRIADGLFASYDDETKGIRIIENSN